VFRQGCWEAFKELKARLTSILILCHYNPKYKYIIKTDALDGVIASVFSQLYPDGQWYLVAYFLKTIALVETNYKIYNKEILVIIKSLAE
jgi:hypothetical protein